VEIEIGGDGGGPAAKEVIIVASNVTAGVEPIRRAANVLRAGAWEVRGLHLIPAGEWSIRVEALVSDFEKLTFEDTVELR
jgi:copper transport protein